MNQIGLSEFYRGKSIFLTGSTGFVGKVLLEKLLRSLPQLAKIYILIRGKKGSNVNERFKKEILGSQCFDRLKKVKGFAFDDYISSKIIAVEGDLLKEGLGLSKEDENMITDNVNIIINCAASVDFNSTIVDALSINFYGSRRIMDLAIKSKNLNNFVHISTAYVNSDRPQGFVDEKIYEKSYTDISIYVSELMKTCKGISDKQTQVIIGKFPNTYTFTKSLAERMLQSIKPDNMSLTILRPTIVGCSLRDPFPGWIDNMIGSSAMYFFSGIGLIKILKGKDDITVDQIPVDFVADHIIVASAYQANKGQLEVMHIGSSSGNPVKSQLSIDCIREYWNQNIPKTKVGKCNVVISKSDLYYNLYNQTRLVQALAYKNTANILGNESMKKNSSRWMKMIQRAHMINETFEHFFHNEWIFSSEKTNQLINYLTNEEQLNFQLDVAKINWRNYLLTFNYGLQKFILKENVDPPGDPQITNLLSLTMEYGSDFSWALNQGQSFNTKTKKEHISLVLNSQRVQQAMKQLQQERIKKLALNEQDSDKESQKVFLKINKEAIEICDQMFADYSFKVIRMMAYLLNKVFKKIYEKVVLDENFLNQLANHNQKLKGPIVFLPTHKSYLDFLIASYIFYAFKIKCPHVAATEDFLQMSVVPSILRACGAFFLKRKQFEENLLYKEIFYEYVQRLMMDECYLEFFVEGTRSRTGKIMQPKFGLLGIVIDTVIENKIPDATFIPMTINYEKVFEADTYPLELLGESKVKESFLRVLNATKIMNNNQGRIYIEFGEPISIQKQLKQKKQENPNFNPALNVKQRKQFTENIGYELVYTLMERLIILPTSMVAAIILMHRKGIQEDQLVKKIEWLANQIQQRGGRIGSINDCSAEISVRNSINHLKDTVVKTKRNIFELQLTPNLEYKNILLLSYYKNKLLHVFFQEAICTCALNSFGHQLSYKEGITINRLWEESEFLIQLLNNELLVRSQINTYLQFQNLIDQMVSRSILTYVDAKDQSIKQVKVHQAGEQTITFLCSLIWPIIESYWITLIYIYSIQSNNSPTTVKRLIQQIQWFSENNYEERVLDHYESCSMETITNAVQMFDNMKIIQIGQEYNVKKQKLEENVKVIATEEKILELENYLKKFMKNAFTRSTKTPIDMLKTTIIDFPILSKL